MSVQSHHSHRCLHAHIISKDIFTPGRRQSKTVILSTNVDKKSLEIEISIAVCRRNRKHCFWGFLSALVDF